MVDASNPDYLETLCQIDALRSSMLKLDERLSTQIPQGLQARFDSSKAPLFHWIDEIEFTLQEFNQSQCR